MADSLESILKDLREQLLTNVDARPIADDACDKEIIPAELKTSINQAKSVREANMILYQHLLQQGTQSKLKELCTIMINAKGYGRMIEFGQVLQTKITAPVEQCIEVCQQTGSDGIEVVDSHMLWQINRIAEQRTSDPVLALPTGPAFPGPPQPTPVRGLAMAINPLPDVSALSLESCKRDIVSCDVNVFESQKEHDEAIRSLYFNAYNHFIRVLSIHCSAIKSVALSAVRTKQVSATEVEVKQACDLCALFECLEVDKKWNDLEFLSIAITSLPVEASKEKGAAQLVLSQYKSYLTHYMKAVSIKEGKSALSFLQRKRGREERMVVSEITVDKEIDEYTCHDLLNLWKLFLIETLEIPKDRIEFRLAKASNSTTLVFMITQTYAEGMKEQLSKPAAVWVMKELGILRVYVAEVVSVDLREVLPNVLNASIREGLESGVDFVSLTKVFSRQFLALVGPTDHPLENSNNTEVQHRRLLKRLLKAPPSHRFSLQESHDKDVPQTLKVEQESEGRMQLQSAYAGERHMPIAFPSELAEGESDPHKEPEPATVKGSSQVSIASASDVEMEGSIEQQHMLSMARRKRPPEDHADHEWKRQKDSDTADLPQGDVAILSEMVSDHPRHLMLFRSHISRRAAGKGRAVLEGVGLDVPTIAACFTAHPSNEEGAVQEGLTKWCAGAGFQPPTWRVLVEAIGFANIAQQDIEALIRALS